MEKVKEWLKAETGSGYGYGDGYGYGYGDGSGSGSGDGYGSGYGDGYGSGYGSGDGSGSGSGDGYGDGYGVKSFKGQTVYYIDGVATIINYIKLNLAKGYILNDDFTLTPCYVAKNGRLFAHGETAKKAQEALQAKILENMDADEAISKFRNTFEKNVKYPGTEFYKWHHYLTGSCEMGRESFVKNKGLDVNAEYTVEEFINICKDAYGGDIIKRLAEAYIE